MPLHGSCADAFALAQTAAADSVPVPAEDHLAECFRGVLAFEQSRKLLTKVPAATPALPFARIQDQFTLPKTPTLMPDPPLVASFASDVGALALRARNFSRISRPNAHLPRFSLNLGNLVIGQS